MLAALAILNSFIFSSTGPNAAGVYVETWDTTPLKGGKVYSTQTTIQLNSGGAFTTPSQFDVSIAQSFAGLQNEVAEKLDIPLSEVSAAVEDKLNIGIGAINTTLGQFQSDIQGPISDLKEAADDTADAASDALISAGVLESAAIDSQAAAERLEQIASLALLIPAEATTGLPLTVGWRGPEDISGLAPLLTIENSKGESVVEQGVTIEKVVMTPVSGEPGLFEYAFKELAAKYWLPAKNVTVIVQEEALGSLLKARIALNRVLHRRLDTPFLAENVDAADPALLTGHPRFRGVTETERRYDAFTAFMVREGLAASPELGGLDELIAAGERGLTAARRAFWAPTLGLEASLDEILSRGGAGSTPPALPLFELPRADDRSWSVALRAALPLFEGGGRIAERVQAEIELARLRLERTLAAERIEQRIRTAMAATWATFPGVSLSRQAAVAARKNLDLVADAYARGAVSILDLLDAQNAARNADELAANAVYDFLIELMEAERSTATFQFFMTAEEREAWFDRLERYFAERGIVALDPRLPAAYDLLRGGD